MSNKFKFNANPAGVKYGNVFFDDFRSVRDAGNDYLP